MHLHPHLLRLAAYSVGVPPPLPSGPSGRHRLPHQGAAVYSVHRRQRVRQLAPLVYLAQLHQHPRLPPAVAYSVCPLRPHLRLRLLVGSLARLSPPRAVCLARRQPQQRTTSVAPRQHLRPRPPRLADSLERLQRPLPQPVGASSARPLRPPHPPRPHLPVVACLARRRPRLPTGQKTSL